MEPSEGYVKVLGFKIYYRSFGRPDRGTVLILSGGPFTPHNMLLPMADLVQFGYRVVLYDQLGCGRSDRPKDAKYYTANRVMDDVEVIRRALRLGRVHLFGSSCGGALALNVALNRPRSLRSLVIQSGFASEALADSEMTRLFSHLPKWVANTIDMYEKKGDFKNPGYLAAMDVWHRKHLCRLRVYPYDLWYTGQHIHEQGPGHDVPSWLTGWNITDRLPEIKHPCLITVGEYDQITQKCAQAIHDGIRGSRIVMLRNTSHLPMWEDRVRFMEVVRDFLDGVSA